MARIQNLASPASAGGGLTTIDNPATFTARYGAASAIDQEFSRTGSPTTLPGSWVFQSQNAATYLEEQGAGKIHIPSGWNTIQKTTAIVQPLPGDTVWTAWGKVYNPPWTGATIGLGMSMGLGLTDGTKGMAMIWNTNPFVLAGVWSDMAAAYSGNPGTVTVPAASSNISYFKIHRNSATSYDWYFSWDGILWVQILAAYDVTTQIAAPTHLGFLTRQDTGVQDYAIDWFRYRNS